MRQETDRNSDVDTRTRIIDTAETLFSEQGFAIVTTRQIASAASVSLSARPYHFGSKAEQDPEGEVKAPLPDQGS